MVWTERYVTTAATGGGDGLSEATAWTLAEARSNAAAGMRINIKSGTYNLSGTFAVTAAGTFLSPICWQGYQVLPGDSIEPAATIDMGGGSAPFMFIGTYNIPRCLHFTNSAAFGLGFPGAGCTAYRCRVDSCATGIYLSSSSCAIDCEVSGCSIVGIGLASAGASASGCHIHDCTANGIAVSNTAATGVGRCIVARCGGHGIVVSDTGANNAVLLSHITSVNNGGSGVAITDTTEGATIQLRNSIVANNAGYGLSADATGRGVVVASGVGLYGNAAGDIDSNVLIHDLGLMSLLQTPVVDPSNDDYRLVADLIGTNGERILGGGFPRQFLVNGTLSSWESFPDLGAVDRPTPVRS